MAHDVIDLCSFYASPLGKVARRFLLFFMLIVCRVLVVRLP